MKNIDSKKRKKLLIFFSIAILLLIPYIFYAPVLFLFPFKIPISPGMKTEENIRTMQADYIDDSHDEALNLLNDRGFRSSLYAAQQTYFMYNGNPYIFYYESENGKIIKKGIIVDTEFNEYNTIHNAIEEKNGFVFIVDDYLYYITGKGYERSGRLLMNTMHSRKVYYSIKYKKQLLLDSTSTEITISENEYIEALNAFNAN